MTSSLSRYSGRTATRLTVVALVFGSGLFPVACQVPSQEEVFQGPTMGTSYTVKVAASFAPEDIELIPVVS